MDNELPLEMPQMARVTMNDDLTPPPRVPSRDRLTRAPETRAPACGVDLDDDGDLDAPSYCIPGCPDDVCRMSGRCAWSAIELP